MRIVLHKTMNPRNAEYTGMGGMVLFQGMNEERDCPVFGVVFANKRTAIISDDGDQYTLLDRCARCLELYDFDALSKEYGECPECDEITYTTTGLNPLVQKALFKAQKEALTDAYPF